MGVIKKKSAHPGRVEPGVRYICDVCNGDITLTVSNPPPPSPRLTPRWTNANHQKTPSRKLMEGLA